MSAPISEVDRQTLTKSKNCFWLKCNAFTSFHNTQLTLYVLVWKKKSWSITRIYRLLKVSLLDVYFPDPHTLPFSIFQVFGVPRKKLNWQTFKLSNQWPQSVKYVFAPVTRPMTKVLYQTHLQPRKIFVLRMGHAGSVKMSQIRQNMFILNHQSLCVALLFKCNNHVN